MTLTNSLFDLSKNMWSNIASRNGVSLSNLKSVNNSANLDIILNNLKYYKSEISFDFKTWTVLSNVEITDSNILKSITGLQRIKYNNVCFRFTPLAPHDQTTLYTYPIELDLTPPPTNIETGFRLVSISPIFGQTFQINFVEDQANASYYKVLGVSSVVDTQNGTLIDIDTYNGADSYGSLNTDDYFYFDVGLDNINSLTSPDNSFIKLDSGTLDSLGVSLNIIAGQAYWVKLVMVDNSNGLHLSDPVSFIVQNDNTLFDATTRNDGNTYEGLRGYSCWKNISAGYSYWTQMLNNKMTVSDLYLSNVDSPVGAVYYMKTADFDPSGMFMSGIVDPGTTIGKRTGFVFRGKNDTATNELQQYFAYVTMTNYDTAKIGICRGIIDSDTGLFNDSFSPSGTYYDEILGQQYSTSFNFSISDLPGPHKLEVNIGTIDVDGTQCNVLFMNVFSSTNINFYESGLMDAPFCFGPSLTNGDDANTFWSNQILYIEDYGSITNIIGREETLPQ